MNSTYYAYKGICMYASINNDRIQYQICDSCSHAYYSLYLINYLCIILYVILNLSRQSSCDV